MSSKVCEILCRIRRQQGQDVRRSLHDFVSPEVAEKLEQPEGFEIEIEQHRDGEKLWDCIRDVLIVGASEPSPDINRRRAEQYFETFKQDQK